MKPAHWLPLGLGITAFAATATAASLYQAQTFAPLTSDVRSYRVGDAVTVLVAETSTAESQAASQMQREHSLSVAAQGVTAVNAQRTVGLDLKHGNDNSGSTARSGTLQAAISVRVQQVAANGDLTVYGEQLITVNGEEQRITVSGMVRPIDILSDNTVNSTRLTDAKIDYSGRGFVNRSQSEGWISRLFDAIGL